MTLVTSAITVDTWASEGRPGDTHGPDPVLVLAEASGARKWAYLKPAPPWPTGQGVTVAQAKLRLRLVAANPSAATTIEARRIEETWTAGTLAWKRRPATVAAADATVVVAGSAANGTLVELDVTAAMQAVADGEPYFGFRLSCLAGTTRGPLKVASASGSPATSRPELLVEWYAPPDVPVGLEPGGARFVSTRKPALAWQFGDETEPDPHQSGYQVQIDDAADFAAPEFDTGQVVSGRSGVDLAATAYAGLPTDGAIRWWRVRVADEGGLWSAYSAPVQTRYAPLGVVLVTAPGATTPDVRPTVTWTFTPAAAPAGFSSPVQRVWRARIERQDGNRWVPVADSGDVSGTDLAWAPDYPLTVLGATYRAVVEVLDALDRTARSAAGDRARDDQVFTWAVGGGASPPTGFNAVVAEGAFVDLTWARATRPDHWLLVADGRVMEDGIDVVPAGTNYAFRWYGARPRAVHNLSLHAVEVVGTATSTSPAAVKSGVYTSPTGIWLVDAYDGRRLHIAGKDQLGAGIGESSALHTRIGDRAPVLITEIVRGYEGDVSGVLVDWDGYGARAGKDLLIDLRESAVALRVILGDLNLPVAIYDVMANPTPDVDDQRFNVAFSFVQRAEFDRL